MRSAICVCVFVSVCLYVCMCVLPTNFEFINQALWNLVYIVFSLIASMNICVYSNIYSSYKLYKISHRSSEVHIYQKLCETNM
jgi:hypothetical protein